MKQSSLIDKICSIVKSFDSVTALGMSGSRALDIHDNLSDFDFCVYTSPLPAPAQRKRFYLKFGIDSFDYFDVDFEVSRGDGFRLDGFECGILWMEVPQCHTFLKNLHKDHNCDEFLPGGLEKTVPLFDRDNIIEGLKSEIPEYSDERAVNRIRNSISSAHFKIDVLKWFDKAVKRNDYFSFMKYQTEITDDFITALFALNKKWYSDEKRLTDITGRFELQPINASERLERLMMHEKENSTLPGSLESIKQFYADLIEVSGINYPDIIFYQLS